ncbi:MAG: aminoacyl-tRNA hydrolase [Spirochaetaceae bacterium]|jgi:ribosome-associated protein|nr:aminoacyl-tRNA hydrolase [Spirochaetaceae bacterium]
MNKDLLRISIENNTRFSFARSGGKGGQNVNKVNTKVRAAIRVGLLEGLSEAELVCIRSRLKNRVNSEDELFVDAEDERAQERNRAAALSRLESLITGAAKIPPRRKKTRPTAASVERRLKSKKVRSLLKQARKPAPGSR